jgi:acetyl esterase/lipase
MENKIQAASAAPLVTYQLDGEISKSLNDFFNGLGPIDKVPAGDFHQMKKVGNQVYAMIKEKLPAFADVKREDLKMKAGDGSDISLRWYSPGAQAAKGPAVVFIHGGGRMYGSVDLYDHTVAEYVHHSNVPFLSVEYGLTPDTYGKAQAEQALDAVLWLKENAAQFGVDVNRIAIMGDSGGGGIAAGAAILARDRNVFLAKQILIYPMIDYRNIVIDESLESLAVVKYQELATLWEAIIGPHQLSDYDLMITSPAYLDNFKGLATAYISVGDLDYFRNENLDYVRRLAAAAVPVEFHLHPNAPHGFEIFTPETALAKRAMADHMRAIQSV